MQRLGFIGLGTMGEVMCRRLMAARYPMTVWNRTAQRGAALIKAGAAWADTPREVARASDVVFTMVTDSVASEAVICGPDGVLDGARPGLPRSTGYRCQRRARRVKCSGR